ncbi:hypothetical protein [Flavobacterium sp. GSB-24]|uniref:hypothetical protein n=1 Tax=Flavobacterium sp. GSB-24 TaxID=2994319 RepID=UPI00248F8162|nr:hypothetical protein [Flavobacterium sp. GSB-24]BDU25182.1 hypothetical protein FLGSB24_19260 [Flavobacterium sp. GSB-24]
MKKTILLLTLVFLIIACDDTKKVPADILNRIKDSYTTKSLTGKKIKLSEVKSPTAADATVLPTWISNKMYVTENADALKYNPAALIGSLIRLYPNGEFEVFPVTYNVRIENELPELTSIAKPINFYEQTFTSSTRFNADFVVGGINIESDEMMKISYTETNYINLEKFDSKKLENLKNEIKAIPNSNLKDWAIVRGIVLTDCAYTKHKQAQADANVKASWLSANTKFYRQTGNSDNFRLLSIDKESLFLDKE